MFAETQRARVTSFCVCVIVMSCIFYVTNYPDRDLNRNRAYRREK